MSDRLMYLAANGAAFVKVRPRDKRPLETGWQAKPLSLEDIAPYVQAGGNVGLLTGGQSNGVCVLDLDRGFGEFCQRTPHWAASVQVVRADAPDRGKILVRVTDGIPRSRVWKESGHTSPSAECLADGRQAVIPPSVHPNGVPYQWRNAEASIIEVSLAEFEAVWTDWTGEHLTFRLQVKEQGVFQRGGKSDEGLVDRVKQAWPTALGVFEFHGLALDVESENREQVRLKGNGGLICGTGSLAWQWYNHTDQIGGDQIDAWGYIKYETSWNRNNPTQFRSVLREMADAAGIAAQEPSPRTQAATPPNPKDRVDAALAKAGETLDPGIPFEIVADLVMLPTADQERAISEFKDILKRKLNLASLRKVIREQQDRSMARGKATSFDDGTDNLPRIVVNDRQLSDATRASIEALEMANIPPSIFTFGTAVARIGWDSDSRAKIEYMGEMHMRNALSKVAKFYREDPNTGRATAVFTPRDIAQNILAEPQLPFPPLVQVVEVPILRPDGSIVSDPGYDPVTAVYYAPAPGLDIPSIPESPTAEDVARAVTLLREEYLGDFAFEDEASSANAVAFVLTPLVRPTLNGNAPMGCVSARKMGTGKTTFVGSVAVLMTGRAAALLSDVGSDVEWRKQITTFLSEGSTFNVIDNVDGTLSAPSLARALTAQYWKDRRLGGNESIEVPQKATWAATGNNLLLGGDLWRRCVWIAMDAKVARPWERSDFRHRDFQQWVMSNRGRLIAALLTIVRAWYVAGQPIADTPTLGSFEEWVRVVGGILAHCGIQGFLGNQAAMYERMGKGDDEWEAFLLAWELCIGDRKVMTSEVADMLGKDEGKLLKETLPSVKLVESLESDGADSFKRKLGIALAKKQGTRFGTRNLHILRVDNDRRTGQPIWRLGGDELEITV